MRSSSVHIKRVTGSLRTPRMLLPRLRVISGHIAESLEPQRTGQHPHGIAAGLFVDRHVEDRRQNALTRRFSGAQPTVMRANPETYRSEHHAKTLRLAEEAQAQNSNRD